MRKLPGWKYAILLLSNVLWDKGLRKYVKCYKQGRFYDAELIHEEAVTSKKYFTMQNCLVKKLGEYDILQILEDLRTQHSIF
jgi:hypothetical protein